MGCLILNKIVIIQARTGSTRLPNKVLYKLFDKTILDHVVERVRKSKLVDKIVIATTDLEEDNLIVSEAKRLSCEFYRGSEENVLERYYKAAVENSAEVVIRITSDCPLIDPRLIDDFIGYYVNNDVEMVSNAGVIAENRTYPRGLDIEVFSFDILEKSYKYGHMQHHIEHVTQYIYENSKKVYYYKNEEDYSNFRWTLDTKEDLNMIKEIYNGLYKGEHNFYFDEILEFVQKNEWIPNMNKDIEQKKILIKR